MTGGANSERKEGWYRTCTGCGRDIPDGVSAALRGPFASLMEPLCGDLSHWRALCPHCAEMPPEPDEVEMLFCVQRNGS